MNLNLQTLQARKHFGNGLRILHDRALGDLEVQAASGYTGGAENPAHRIDETALRDLMLGDVDAHRQIATAANLLLPGTTLAVSVNGHLHVQGVGHRHHRVDDFGIVVVGAEHAHERSIDLEHVEWKAMQIAQGRVSGPEVVHVNLNLQILQARKHFGNRLRVLHDRALGDLEVQAASGYAGGAENPAHRIDETALRDLMLGNVDAHRQLATAANLLLPGPGTWAQGGARL